MIFSTPKSIEMWEAVATLQILQAMQRKQQEVCIDPKAAFQMLYRLGGIASPTHDQLAESDGHQILNYAGAYRAAEASDRAYCDLLEEESGYKDLPIDEPQINIPASVVPEIILSPSGLKAELNVPQTVWAAVVRHLRSYGLRVELLGQPGERLDYAAFAESENLSDLPLMEQLCRIATCQLMVGVPNAWTWLATAWGKPMVLMYPDSLPTRRWFPFDRTQYAKMLYPVHQLQIPVVIAGLRKLIGIL